MIRPDRLTLKAQEAFKEAADEARRRGNPVVNDAHLFLALLAQDEGIVQPQLQKVGLNVNSFREQTEREIARFPTQEGGGCRADLCPESAESGVSPVTPDRGVSVEPRGGLREAGLMRKHWIVAVAVAVVAALASCGDDPGPATTAPAEPSAQSAITAPATASAGFAEVVRNRVPEVAVDRRDEEIQAIADQACADLAGGEDADAVVAGARTLGTSDAEATDQATARELIKLAIDTTCPDQDRRVDEF